MKRIVSLLLIFVFALSACGGGEASQPAPQSSSPSGGEGPSPAEGGEAKHFDISITYRYEETRAEMLELAAQRVSEQLAQQGENVTFTIVHDRVDGEASDFRNGFVLKYNSNASPDLIAANFDVVPLLAESGYLREVSDIRNLEAYADVYDSLWAACEYGGNTYAVIQDTESRQIWYVKEHMYAAGWTDESLAQLNEDIIQGKVTIYDFFEIMQDVAEKSGAEYALTHRPKTGPDLSAMLPAVVGASVYDKESGKLLCEREKMIEAMQLYYDMVYTYKITPADMTTFTWEDIEGDLWPNCKITAWFGGTWNKGDIMNAGGKSAEYVDETYGWLMIPSKYEGEKPINLSNPYVYMVSNQVDDEKYEYIKMILAAVMDPDIQVHHVLGTAHLAINRRTAEYPEYMSNKFLSDMTYMLDYSMTPPSHKDWPLFDDEWYRMVQAVELGRLTPEQAVDNFIKTMENDLGDQFMTR